MAVARGSNVETLIKMALTTGMRRGELLGLKWQDIDFNNNVLGIRHTMGRVPKKFHKPGQRAYAEGKPKTKKSRRGIVLIPFAIEALKLHREQQQEKKQKAGESWVNQVLVFCTSIGTPLTPDRDVRLPFKMLLQEANLPDIRFHDLRHSAATLLLSLGVHPKIVQEILGHSTIAVTMNIYSHVLPTMQGEAMDKLSNVFMEWREDEQKENPEE